MVWTYPPRTHWSILCVISECRAFVEDDMQSKKKGGRVFSGVWGSIWVNWVPLIAPSLWHVQGYKLIGLYPPHLNSIGHKHEGLHVCRRVSSRAHSFPIYSIYYGVLGVGLEAMLEAFLPVWYCPLQPFFVYIYVHVYISLRQYENDPLAMFQLPNSTNCRDIYNSTSLFLNRLQQRNMQIKK